MNIKNRIISPLERALIYNLSCYSPESKGWKSITEIKKTDSELINHPFKFKSQASNMPKILERLKAKKIVESKIYNYSDKRNRPRKRLLFRLRNDKKLMMKLNNTVFCSGKDLEESLTLTNILEKTNYFLKTEEEKVESWQKIEQTFKESSIQQYKKHLLWVKTIERQLREICKLSEEDIEKIKQMEASK